MRKNVVILSLFIFSISLSALAQDCYTPNRAQGIRSFNAKKYAEALQYFNEAKACSDKPANNDLASWIKKSEDRSNADLTLEVSPETIDLPSEGGSVDVEVKTKAAIYYIENTPTWCKIDKRDDRFKISVPANSYSSVKQDSLIIKAGTRSVTVSIVQQSKISEEDARRAAKKNTQIIETTQEVKPIYTGINPDKPLSLDKDTLSFSSEGGIEIIKISTPDPYYGVSGFPGWLAIDSSNTHIEVSCSPNRNKKARQIEIFVVTEDEKKGIFIKQEAAE